MPRAGWVKPLSETRLSDLVSVGLLTRVFPPDLVAEVIAAAGRTELRRRALPAPQLSTTRSRDHLIDQIRRKDPCQQPDRHQIRQTSLRQRLHPSSTWHAPKLHHCHFN